MADSVVLNRQSYCKILLHVFKYPHCALNGLLLAQKQKGKESKPPHIVDTVPLFHLNIGLTPMMEVALSQVDAYCRAKNLVIAGYYQANESFTANSPDLVSCRVTEKIAEHFGDAVLLMVENDKLKSEVENAAFTVYSVHDGKAKKRDVHKVQVQGAGTAAAITATLLATKQHWQLVDFDNHLDDVSLDWTNADVCEKIRCAL
ncbi:PREDICTED: ER membrane protein complex subunit 8-like [Priapulus caudatus]|uniref:ER membrane protein complex subunit 8-like n=1 Tax=Priapulus caudatus TaxID=37621 RepID=A0ABM1E3X8_PRICU|nr:PREDICTED: ER membrane protein complex subunit 8-like [Priapulus caudatus]